MPVIGQPETLLDFINDAAILSNAIGSGETLNPDELVMGFFTLNQMIDEWDADLANLYTIAEKFYSLQANKQAYTVGPALTDFIDPRPARIQLGSMVIGAFSFELEIANFERWNSLVETNRKAARPEVMYCDYGSPVATLQFSPIPDLTSGATKAHLWIWQQIGQFVALTDPINFPPGYGKALKYSLAAHIGPKLGANVPDLVIQEALGAKATIRALNAANFGMLTPAAPSPAPPAQPPQQ